MREKDKNGALYKAAKEAVRSFTTTLQKELEPMTFEWSERRPTKYYTGIEWSDPEKFDFERYFGKEPGMYLIACDGEAHIWFPKTSVAYDTFYDTMCKLHEEDDDFLEQSIPMDVDIGYDGNETIEFKIYIYVHDRANEEEYISAKTIAEELMEMLSDMEGFEKFTYYEGDNEGNTDPNVKHSNYYVGISSTYNMWMVM